jgi:four helix bundle protein
MEKANFENLRVYQETINLVEEVYNTSDNFPKQELYGLTSQLNRAVTSILLNIAESQGRESHADKKRFLMMGRGSAFEVLAIIEICKRRNLINEQKSEALRKRMFPIIKQINAMIGFFRKQP